MKTDYMITNFYVLPCKCSSQWNQTKTDSTMCFASN